MHQTFKIDNHEAIYGLGIQQQGKMSQRNTNLRMVQGNTDDYVTFFQSVKDTDSSGIIIRQPTLPTLQMKLFFSQK